MKTEKLENGIVMIGLTKEELEDSIAGLSQLKPVLQAQVFRSNGKNVKQNLDKNRDELLPVK